MKALISKILCLYGSFAVLFCDAADDAENEGSLLQEFSFIGICKVVRDVDADGVFARLVPVKVLHQGKVERVRAFEMGEAYLSKEGKLVALSIGVGREGEKRLRDVDPKKRNPVMLLYKGRYLKVSDVEGILRAPTPP